MSLNTKKRLISAINNATKLESYEGGDCIFSKKYAITPVNMVYILMNLAKEFKFAINDDFVDAMENCTFTKLESLLEQYENTAKSQ